MRYLATTLISLLSIFNISAQGIDDVLARAGSLVEEQKYLTAYQMLQSYDPHISEPEILIAKTDIVLNYHVSTVLHQMFGLADLAADQCLDDYRKRYGDSFSVRLNASDEFLRLIRENPDDFRLHKGLADYYLEVFRRYGDNWLIDADELEERIIRYYIAAAENGVYDYTTYNGLGYLALAGEGYSEALANFIRASELNPNDPRSQYKAAYSLLFLDRHEEALEYAVRALDNYTESGDRGDAARLAATIMTEKGDSARALEYYELSNSEDPDNYYTLTSFLAYAISTGDPRYESLTGELHLLDPLRPAIYNDLIAYYSEADKVEELERYLRGSLSNFSDDRHVRGTIHVYLGGLLFEHAPDRARNAFIQARSILEPVMPGTDPMMRIIEESLHRLEQIER